MRLEAEAGFGWVNRELTYERRLSTLVLASRNLANSNPAKESNGRCPRDVITRISYVLVLTHTMKSCVVRWYMRD